MAKGHGWTLATGCWRYTIPVSSGIIAGESLMGVLIALLQVFDVIVPH